MSVDEMRDNKLVFRAYQRADRAWVTDANVHFYKKCHDFNETFANAVNAALDLLEDRLARVESTYLMAEYAGRPVGCIFLSPDEAHGGRIRLFFLQKEHRGQAIGKRLLQTVLAQAQKTGLRYVRVSTFDQHFEACRLYESLGFKNVKKMQAKAFGRTMQQLDYELRFA